jgi:GMP synthase-like glutamine amidotransferase
MQPATASINVLMSCQDQVLDLPPGAEVLGGTAHCPVGIFRMGRMLGIQGHPEFTPAYAEALLQLRRERIGTERVDKALVTLHTPLHPELLATWTTNFCNEPHANL